MTIVNEYNLHVECNHVQEEPNGLWPFCKAALEQQFGMGMQP